MSKCTPFVRSHPAVPSAGLRVLLITVLFLSFTVSASAAPVLNAREPAPSPDGSRIVVSYMGDLWIVSSGGGTAQRLTVHEAFDDQCVWSPDGKSIAFTSDRDGNGDVYVIPAEGGAPKRLTWHSSWDSVNGWTRDGSGVLFTSYRDSLESELYEVSVEGGLPTRVVADRAFNVSVSPDGRWIAYARGRTPWWRKHYQGSASRDIWIRSYDGGESVKLVGSPIDEGRPMWGADGKTLYFTAEDDAGVANIWRISLDIPDEREDRMPSVTGGPEQITRHEHDGVQAARISEDGRTIVYEWDAGVWRLSVPDGAPEEVPIDAPSDLKWNEERRLTLSGQATEFVFSPDEDELAIVVRGEVFVCPFKDGDAGTARRVTKTAAREKDIAWMPDGETLLYASDRSGNYDLYSVTSVDDDEPDLSKALKVEEVRLTESEDDEFAPMPSPDGERIAFLKGDKYLWAMAPDGSDPARLLPEAEILHVDWSPDSRWIAFSRTTMGHKEDIFILPSDGGEARNVTEHPNDDFQPRWTSDGERLSFASRTDEGQYFIKYAWLDRDDYWMSDEEREEKAEEESSEDAEDGEEEDGAEPVVEVKIDFEGLNERIETVMTMRGGYDFFAQTPDGDYFAFRSPALGSSDLWLVDREGNHLEQICEGGCDPEELTWSADGTTCYYITHGGSIASFSIDPDSGGVTGRGGIGFSVSMTVNTAEERKEMFNEAWRLLWNGFYDPEFHGVDWKAVRDKYEPLALAAYTEEEFRMVVREMIGELSASHLGIYRYGGGGASTGRLGVYHDEGHDGPGIRVRKVIADGPAEREGIEPGEYILAIDGTEIAAGENYYRLLDATTGEETLLEIASSVTGKDRREVRLRPLGAWTLRDLVYEQWVRDRRAMVERLSDGRLGYLHIAGMGLGNLLEFEEDLFAQGEGKSGVIVDIRGNGGGSVHDRILRYLDRRTYGYETSRSRPPSYNPLELYTAPVALLIDESCYSDAEIFPMGWKALGLGPVIGTPTFGAVIGTNDVSLIDGTMFRVPGSGWFDLEGKNLENWGIEPDVRIDTLPEEARRGEDRQLAKAVDVLLAEIAGR